MSYAVYRNTMVIVTDELHKVPLLKQHAASIIIVNDKIVKNRWGAIS
jgi:hypothetical protein